ncbi:hypothetical protein [Paractinoplanes rishiriensis]|uniref:Uncharacterized protein n=1 Tax=Paractinoplanes rishiriensis TaxID=1050105 RepID=A0A919JXR4_9ACTN|nr:hypothetical protein [Actinoplanes rishiriensis]GIE97171.1 hypothetical protein Ari01nite_46360 [Actinoplanes rishiriensis]
MQTTDDTKPARDSQTVELASPSEIGLLALAVGAVATVLFRRRRRRRANS